MKKRLALWLASRLREPSTWLGIITAVAGWIGRDVDAAELKALAEMFAYITAAVLVLWPDRRINPKPATPHEPGASSPFATGDHDRGDDVPAGGHDDGLRDPTESVPASDPTEHRIPIGGAREVFRRRRERDL